MAIHVGCCGMQMARAAYFQRFALTEVQQTFYQPPRAATLAGWRAEAPAGFEFTLKAWQLITHTPHSPTYKRLKTPIDPKHASRYGRFQLTDEVLEAWRVTLESVRALQARLIIFQCPPSFSPSAANVANLRAFFGHIRPERGGLICGWEPRGNWPESLVRELTGELNLLHVIDPFVTPMLPDLPLRYFRLHGKGGYRYQYTDSELRQVLTWSMQSPQTYVLFNNIPMVADAHRFEALLVAQGMGNVRRSPL